MADTAATPKPATTRAAKIPKTRQDFAGTVKDVRAYCEMKIQVLKEVSGDSMQETTKAQIAELTAILAKLGGAGK